MTTSMNYGVSRWMGRLGGEEEVEREEGERGGGGGRERDGWGEGGRHTGLRIQRCGIETMHYIRDRFDSAVPARSRRVCQLRFNWALAYGAVER